MTQRHAPPAHDALDPVCGMTISTESAVAQAEIGGTTWYFCSPSCHERFTGAPQQYAETGPATCCGSGS